MVDLSILLFVGVVLIAAGGIICLYWYVYWQCNFRGELLTDGLYRVVRHPFYTGFILFTLGLTIVLPIYETRLLSILTLAVMVVYIPREEEQLLKQYKHEYREYMEKVKWRLVPYLY
jgi:protein-S-isoprenylcysteine O-methyltransferase Ste14